MPLRSSVSEEELARLEKLSVKDLRRQAALRNVPLTQIGAAVEKQDLINLICRASPVLDHYDVSTGVKVHTAESIAKALLAPKVRKKKRRRRRSSSSSSSRGSRSSPRRKRERKRSKSRGKRKSKSCSRSSSVEFIRNLPALKAPEASDEVSIVEEAGGALAIKDVPSGPAGAPAKRKSDRNFAQAGMAAAAALGFNVLPKATHAPAAPAMGLRPSIPGTTGTSTSSVLPGSRICIQYLCNSRCDLGSNCPEAHVIDPEEEMRVRARFKDQECHYGATCTRPGCLFRHPGERLEESLMLEGVAGTIRPTSGVMDLR